MNTGVQRSSATPPAARTATTPAVGAVAGQRLRHRQERAAHRDGAPHSLRRDRERVQSARPRAQGQVRDGDPRRALHPHLRALPARLGLGVRKTRSSSRAWPSRRASSRCSKRTTAKSRRARRSGTRFPSPNTSSCRSATPICSAIRRISSASRGSRRWPTTTSTNSACCNRRRHGQAVRDHARRRLEPRQQDRRVAHQPAAVRGSAAAVQPRLPGRREHPGLAVSRRVRRLRSRVARADRGQSAGRRSWGASAITRARPRATAASSTRRSASTRSSAFSATKRSSAAGSSRRPRPRAASACSSSAPDRRDLSAAYHLRRLGHGVKIVEAGPRAGGMMRFGIPKYRLPRDVLDAEIQRILDLGVELRARLQGLEHPRDDAGGPLRRGVPRGRRAHRQARLHSRGRSRAHARRGVGAARHGGRGQADARPARRRVRRRQHRARRRAHGQAAGRHRIDHRLPPHARKDARARLRSRGSAAGRRPDQVAVDDQEHGRRRHADRRKDGARRQGLSAADRRIRDARGRLAGPGARPGRRSVAARRRAGTRDQGRHGAGRRRT